MNSLATKNLQNLAWKTFSLRDWLTGTFLANIAIFCDSYSFFQLISIRSSLNMVDEIPALLEQYGDEVFEITEQGKVWFKSVLLCLIFIFRSAASWLLMNFRNKSSRSMSNRRSLLALMNSTNSATNIQSSLRTLGLF